MLRRLGLCKKKVDQVCEFLNHSKRTYKSSPLGPIVLCLMHKTRLLSSCFKPSKPQKITQGLKQAFVKRYIAKRTNKAETRLEEHSEKEESCRENLWNEMKLKGS